MPITTITIEASKPITNVFLKLRLHWLASTDGKMVKAEMSKTPMVRTPMTMKRAVRAAKA
jgi:hypothetical protein